MDPVTVARGVPLVNDRLLLELINDLHTADDLARAQVRQGFFARLLARVSGRQRQRDTAIRTAMLDAQRRTLDWVTSLGERLAVTDLVVAEVCGEVEKVNNRVDRLESTLSWTTDNVRTLAGILSELAKQTGDRLSDHERRLSGVEGMLAMDDAIRRWRHPRPDPGLPWLVHAILLAREVAAGAAGRHAFSFEQTTIEGRLVERMLQDPPIPWFTGVRSVATMLTTETRELPTEDHRLMLAELLGLGVSERLTADTGPLTQSLATTASLAATAGADPAKAARTALRESGGAGNRYLAASLTADQLVRQIVREQFDEAGRRRAQLSEPADE